MIRLRIVYRESEGIGIAARDFADPKAVKIHKKPNGDARAVGLLALFH